jgi:macrolide transport system ATP-binding/permease protein
MAAVRLLEDSVQDLRYSLRRLGRSPGFTTAALLTLALTIGAVSTVLSLYYAILLRPIAATRPREVVVVAAVRRGSPSSERVTYADYAQIRDHTKTLGDLAGHVSGGLFFLTHHGMTRKLSVAIVSANFFPLLGVKPALGRFFSNDEDRVPGRDHVAVLSHRLWRQEWDASAAALGAAVKIDGVPVTIIGVAPEGFYGIDSRPSEVYVPTMMLGLIMGPKCDAIADPDCAPSLQMIGRVREGRTVEEVKAEVSTLTPARWKADDKNENGPLALTAFRPRGAYGTYGEFGIADGFREGPPLFVVAGLCLLLGCANLGGLLMARGSSRARELAIRASLGPTPLRLLRQLMTESLLLAVGGGALGVILSFGLTRLVDVVFYQTDVAGQPRHLDLRPDGLVMVWVAAISVGAAFLFGLLPALKSVRLGSALTLTRQASSVMARPGLTRWLIGAQVAVALALVTLAALLSASARRFITEGHFDPRHVALLRLHPNYPPERTRELQRAVIQRLEALPGVLAVSLWNRGGVIVSDSLTVMVSSEGRGSGIEAVRAGTKDVAPRYFAVLGTRLLRGRDFDERDSIHSPRVAIVDESLAQRLWPGGNALGSTLVVGEGPPAEVVGVVADTSASVRGEPRQPHLYAPLWQIPSGFSSHFCVRVEGDPAAALPMLMRAVHQLEPDVPISETMPMMSYLVAGDELRTVRLTAGVASYGAALAVLLSAIGIYGTLALSVARRTKEIGVRIAVGAGPRNVLGLIMREEMMVVGSGMAAGLALAWGASRLVGQLLYGTSGDRLAYAGAALVVTVAGLLACWIPARRAARLDPIVALKTD